MPTITDKNFDLAWIVKAQAGEQAAQKAIFLHFAPQVQQLARHILQCEASAEEVVQECFVDVLCKIEGYRHQGSFAGWLRRIAVNHCLMLLRSSWHRKRQVIDEMERLLEDEQQQVDHTEVRELNTVFAALPAQTRAVLWLHDVEGYTHGEIAKFMGKSTSFSKSQLVRAHEKIRNQLRQHCANTQTVLTEGGQPCMPLLNNY